MKNAECGMKNKECGIRNLEFGMRNDGREKGTRPLMLVP